MLPSPRIIAIDDNPLHLKGLADGLNSYGVACLQVEFTGDDSTIRKCPHVRVIFADLHLNESGAGTDDARHFTVIGGLLEQTIAPSGPYAVVLWTRFADKADALRDFLEERLKGIPKPFCVVALDKTVHLDASGKVKDGSALVDALKTIVAGQPQIAALLNWEERVLGAAADTVSAMIELAISGLAPADRNQAIGRLLHRLAIEAVGVGHVESDRFRAVNEALLPILADRVASLKSDAAATTWDTALEGHSADDALDLDDAAKLNRFLHIADASATLPTERGAVVRLPEPMITGFESRFGLSPTNAAFDQFACSGFIEGDAKFKWVLVQIQAPCDFAQQQPGPLPFVLGLEMPAEAVRKSTVPAAVIRCPPFESGGSTRALRLNSRFQVTLSETEAKLLVVEYRLRESLLSDVAYQVHSHGARPGLISFRESKAKPTPAAPKVANES